MSPHTSVKHGVAKANYSPGKSGTQTARNGEIGQPARASKPPMPTRPVADANYYGKGSGAKRV